MIGRKIFAVLVIAVVVAAIAAVVARSMHRTASEQQPAAAPNVATAVAHYGTIDRTIAVSGRAGGSTTGGAKLTFGIGGKVAWIGTAIGDRVTQNQELARLVELPYRLAAQQAQAQAAAQSAAAAGARVDRTGSRLRADLADLVRKRTLFEAGVVAKKDVQAAAAAVAADRADIQVASDQSAQSDAQAIGASAQAGSAAYDLERTSLRAPFDGTVAQINVARGETVDASTPVIVVVPDGASTGALGVSYAQAADIHAGDSLTLRAGNVTWNASVAAIGPAVSSDSGLVPIRISTVPANVASGTPIEGVATVARSRGLLVPASAIVADPETGNTLVFVRSANGRFDTRRVSVGEQNDRWARIVSGLHAGERVASQGAIDLLQQ